MHQTTLERIEQELKKIKRQLQCGTQFFDTVEEFPAVGASCAIYVDKSTGAFYVYDTETATYITADAGEDVDFSLTTTGTSGPATLVGTILNIPQYQGVLTFDNTPTNGSTNPVTSDGVFDALSLKQNNVTLTTTGTSGAATFVGSTLNIPQYQAALTNPVTGTGTAGQVAYWDGTTTQAGSQDFTWNDTTKILSFSNGGTLINEIRISTVNNNTMMGRLAGSSASLSGSFNSFFGSSAGRSNTSGGLNTFSGTSAGQNNTIGNSNSSFGVNSFANSTTGSNNSSFGTSAGRRIADGSNLTIANNGLFIGFDTRASADNNTNETVIGYSAIGLGSNTTVIGNSSTTLTWLGGNLTLGTTTSGGRLTVRGSGTTSATTALLVQNSTPSNLFQITDNGVATLTPTTLTGLEATSALDISQTWNTTGTPTLIKANVTNTASNVDSRLVDLQVNGSPVFRILPTGVVSAFSVVGQFSGILRLRSNLANIAGNYLILDNNNVNITTTTSQVQHTMILSTYSPTSGTGVFNQVAINSTINQTGGANGITRGLYVNPTLTAAADWRGVEITTSTVNTVVLGKNTGSAAVEVTSTTQGVLFPRMTTTQRNAIASPAAGLVIFNTTTTKLECYDGAAWQAAW